MKGKSQQEPIGPQFARVLGRSPLTRAPRYRTSDQFGLFAESFGPPELAKRKNGTILFWNFTRNDGREGFTLFSCVPSSWRIGNMGRAVNRLEVEVLLAAKKGARTFWSWTAWKLAGVETGEEAPLFLGGSNFAVTWIR